MPLKPVDCDITILLGPLIDDTDFKSREESIAYNAAGMEIHIVVEKTDGTVATTAVVPTTGGGKYDWVHTDQGYYSLTLPAEDGVTFNNTEEGVLKAIGYCTGVLPFASVAYDIVPIETYHVFVLGTASMKVGLIDDAITAAKFDETTAFPLASADDGATALARTGEDADTLETLSDQIDTVSAGAIADAVWDEDLSDHDAEGSTGEALAAAAGGGGDPWTTALPAAYGDGTAGKIIGSLLARAGADSDTLKSLSDQIDGITMGIATIVPTTDAPDGFDLTAGSVISGTYVNVQTDDDTRHVLAPAAGGLDATYTIECGEGRAPVTVLINGYWKGSSPGCDVYAYDYDLELWDKLTNSTTRLSSKNADVNYAYQLNREHMDIVQPNVGHVKIRLVSTSTNTADRLNVDSLLVATVATLTGASGGDTGAKITPQDIWEYVTRTLTSATGEPATAEGIADAVWDEAIAEHEAAGSTGAALAAGGDPWSTGLPGEYGAGTAGNILGAQVARTGADGDTLKTLSDELDALRGEDNDDLKVISDQLDIVTVLNRIVSSLAGRITQENTLGPVAT